MGCSATAKSFTSRGGHRPWSPELDKPCLNEHAPLRSCLSYYNQHKLDEKPVARNKAASFATVCLMIYVRVLPRLLSSNVHKKASPLKESKELKRRGAAALLCDPAWTTPPCEACASMPRSCVPAGHLAVDADSLGCSKRIPSQSNITAQISGDAQEAKKSNSPITCLDQRGNSLAVPPSILEHTCSVAPEWLCDDLPCACIRDRRLGEVELPTRMSKKVHLIKLPSDRNHSA
eukprot:6461551-Amphidinium_carterae.2